MECPLTLKPTPAYRNSLNSWCLSLIRKNILRLTAWIAPSLGMDTRPSMCLGKAQLGSNGESLPAGLCLALVQTLDGKETLLSFWSACAWEEGPALPLLPRFQQSAGRGRGARAGAGGVDGALSLFGSDCQRCRAPGFSTDPRSKAKRQVTRCCSRWVFYPTTMAPSWLGW